MGKVMAGAALALMVTTGAAAQGPGAPYPMPGADQPMAGPPSAEAGRWGSQVDGRWWGGANAPGGWSAYRTPYRGYHLNGYWAGPRFQIDNWNDYGFPAPPSGYHWSRYYDDAVLADGRGSVYDWRGGVDWNRGDGRPRRDERNGLVGAGVGAVAGGVAGNVIAGRGNRLGGTLIGAGVGGAAGYAIGHAQGGYRAPPPGAGYPAPGYGADYPPPGYGPEHHHTERRYESGPGYPPPPPIPTEWHSPDGATTVTVTTGGGPAPVIAVPPAAYGYGYGYGYAAGGSVTTVTVQSAPVVTTTTTEIIDDTVYTRPAVRRVYVRKRAWHPRPRRCPPAVIGS